MTPLQFAKAECSNYTQSGGCQGVGIKDDGSLYGFGHKDKCLLATGQRCQYFEECVFPMTIDPCNARNVVRSGEIQEAKRLYRMQTGATISQDNQRICPQCNKKPLEPRKQLCYVCADANQKTKTRERKRKERSDVTVSQISDVDNQ